MPMRAYAAGTDTIVGMRWCSTPPNKRTDRAPDEQRRRQNTANRSRSNSGGSSENLRDENRQQPQANQIPAEDVANDAITVTPHLWDVDGNGAHENATERELPVQRHAQSHEAALGEIDQAQKRRRQVA